MRLRDACAVMTQTSMLLGIVSNIDLRGKSIVSIENKYQECCSEEIRKRGAIKILKDAQKIIAQKQAIKIRETPRR